MILTYKPKAPEAQNNVQQEPSQINNVPLPLECSHNKDPLPYPPTFVPLPIQTIQQQPNLIPQQPALSPSLPVIPPKPEISSASPPLLPVQPMQVTAELPAQQPAAAWNPVAAVESSSQASTSNVEISSTSVPQNLPLFPILKLNASSEAPPTVILGLANQAAVLLSRRTYNHQI